MGQTRRLELFALAIAGSLPVSTVAAEDGLGDARAIKPVLMLVVDTSGSMERVAGTEKIPACSTASPGEKNRWTGAVEALTGSFPGYACVSENRSSYAPTEYDYGYYLPHIAPKPAVLAAQATDGVLDVLGTSAKFGLMTFDGQPTYSGADPLISYTTLMLNSGLIRDKVGDARLAADAAAGAVYTGAASGMYSYGRMARLSFPGCVTDYGMNLGARGPDAPVGGLVSVGISDNGADVRAQNLLVQDTLLNVRPYGGTPIAAVLDDLKYWLDNSPDLKLVEGSPSTPASGDLFEKCRQKYAVLLTDGAPDSLFRDSRYKCDSESYGGGSTAGIDLDGNGTVSGSLEVCAQARNSDGSLKPGFEPACECPYDTERDIAGNIVAAMPATGKQHNRLDRLYVVAFNVPATDVTALAALDAIAVRGNPSATSASTKAARVQTSGELRSALNSIFTSISPKATSRTVPISIDGGDGDFKISPIHYEVRAGFKASPVPELPWDGVLERSAITCIGTQVNYVEENEALGSNDKFHEALNAQSATPGNRFVYTLKGSTGSLPLTAARGTLKGAHLGDLDTMPPTFNASTTGYNGVALGAVSTDSSHSAQQLEVESGVETERLYGTPSVNPAFFGDADGVGGPGQNDDRTRIIDYLNGTLFAGHALADIIHSNPVALGPLVTRGISPRLAAWRSALLTGSGDAGYAEEGNRPQVVFVGTNDGLLHAFNLTEWGPSGSKKAPGHEFWSFFPPALFDKVHSSASPTPQHQPMFDGSIIVKDMLVNPGTPTNPRSPQLATRTILLAAVRGAPAYIALDVTHPELEPEFLWQFSDGVMGNTLGAPALAQVSIEWNGTVQERAMAILPGGEGVAKLTGSGEACHASTGSGSSRGLGQALSPADARSNGRCWRNQGRALYVVDVATGAVVQKFDPRHFPAPLTGGVAVDGSRALTRAAYFTDEDGVLWYLGLDSTDPSKWSVRPIWDVFHGESWKAGRPSSYPPTLARDTSGNDIVLLGTGDVDNLTDSVAHRVVSLTVHHEAVTIGGIFSVETTVQDASTPPVPDKPNWEIELADQESVTGPLSLLEGVLYFASFRGSDSGDACQLGTSTLWGADYLKREGVGLLPAGKLDIDNDSSTVTLGLHKQAGDNEIILGLSVGSGPLCLAGHEQFNQVTGTKGFVATGGPATSSFQIRANVGSIANSGAGVVGGSDLMGFRQEIRARRRAKVVGWAGGVE